MQRQSRLQCQMPTDGRCRWQYLLRSSKTSVRRYSLPRYISRFEVVSLTRRCDTTTYLPLKAPAHCYNRIHPLCIGVWFRLGPQGATANGPARMRAARRFSPLGVGGIIFDPWGRSPSPPHPEQTEPLSQPGLYPRFPDKGCRASFRRQHQDG